MNPLHSLSRSFCVGALAAALLTPAVHADTLTGQVVDANGVGIVGVTLSFSNGANPLNPVTGANGVFALVLNPGTYDVAFDPPAGSGLAPRMLLDVVVSGVSNLGIVRLQPGFAVSGSVVADTGLAVVAADTDLVDLTTGETLFTPGDNTDALGNFLVTAPAGRYRLEIRPALGSTVAPKIVEPVVVTTTTSLGTITLAAGFTLTGTLLDGRTGLPIANADIDVDDARTGDRLLTPNDNTNALGQFSVVVPAGMHHVAFDPPAGLPLLGKQMFNVQVAGATNLGSITCVAGQFLSGLVVGPTGTPMAGVDIDVDGAPGDARVYTPNDKTDATGRYRVVVPPGTYRVTAEPGAGTGLVGVRSAPLTVAAATTVPTLTLRSGVLLSGTVRGQNGAPEARVDIDVVDPATGEKLVTPGDDTDANGHYAVAVPSGTWTVRFSPPKVSASRVAEVTGVAVAGATTLDRQLTLVPVFTFLGTPGIPTVAPGGLLPVLLGFMNPTATAQSTVVSLVVVDPLGGERFLFGPLQLSMPAGSGALSPALVPVFPVAPALLGMQFRLEVRFDEPVTGIEQDHDSLHFVIQ